MKRIESPKNARVKQWKKLLTKKGRDETGLFLIEGFHLVEEAVKSRAPLVELMVDERTAIPHGWDVSVPVVIVTEAVMKAISSTETPQGIAAVCRQLPAELEGVKTALLIDAVQDPGNLGTMIRTADAAGIDAVILGEGCADVYNPKVVRATQGSLFHLPVVKGDLAQWIARFKEQGIPVYGTALENAVDYRTVPPSSSFALLVGNEGSGVRREWLEMTTETIYIPIYGQAESLNVAVAAGILLYSLQAVR
ncbi:RNA methyltransferase [Geobacillus stearothermophilus]|uniref:TrmH family RNA methyltransferase n=1 Tax=Geobacillus stearothermophilus TaxID=1422 RepID=UPI0005198975|nr:RNA methyltransferase [Geobacillus stearothermophilus]MED3777319.1 RNA methyltransferase [Geobacillus stearothermophilus]MED4332393.1 RNA methyltransferase [Geobacillus stearothermophilus]MED4831831.1 RNA methyltransferase [Geobacillus stearothermophilus]MED4961300.1 RNA methyltransferase [Geobacillus stearothermophilus]MED4978486.1 RNA methyltransferase [Geobacillus stearothermophilus]